MYMVREAIMWEDRWAGPQGSTEAWAAQHSVRFLGRDPIWHSELGRSEGDLIEATGIHPVITLLMLEAREHRPLVLHLVCDRVEEVRQLVFGNDAAAGGGGGGFARGALQRAADAAEESMTLDELATDAEAKKRASKRATKRALRRLKPRRA